MEVVMIELKNELLALEGDPVLSQAMADALRSAQGSPGFFERLGRRIDGLLKRLGIGLARPLNNSLRKNG